MSPGSLATALTGLLGLALVGRVALSLMPPGDLGSHRPADLPATWAASHVLGLVCVATATGLGAALGLRVPPRAILVVAALALLARLATLPGAMVPQHEHAPQTGWLGRLAAAAAALALLAPVYELASGRAPAGGPDDHLHASAPRQVVRLVEPAPPAAPADVPVARERAAHAWIPACLAFLSLARPHHDPQAARLLPAVSLVALGVLVAHGLERARRAPAGRWLVVILLATFQPVRDAAQRAEVALIPALLFGAGAALLVPWLRRADRRAALLALVAFAAAGAARGSAWIAGGAGLAVLLLGTHRNARAALLVGALVALALVVLPWRLAATAAPAALPQLGRLGEGFDRLRAAVGLQEGWAPVWVAGAGALLLALAGLSGGRLREERGRAERPGRELHALAALLGLTLAAALLVAAGPLGAGEPLERELLLAVPVVALVAGLVLVRGAPLLRVL